MDMRAARREARAEVGEHARSLAAACSADTPDTRRMREAYLGVAQMLAPAPPAPHPVHPDQMSIDDMGAQ